MDDDVVRPRPWSRKTDAHVITAPANTRLALFIRNLAGGGAESVWLTLAAGFRARGAEVDLVLCRREGDLAQRVPAGVRVVELEESSATAGRLAAFWADPGALTVLARPLLSGRSLPTPFRHLPALACYLRQARPHALMAALPYENLCAVAARSLARTSTRIVVSEHSPPSRYRRSKDGSLRHLAALAARWYPRADIIHAVSTGLAADLAAWANLPLERVRVVHNPIHSPPAGLPGPPHPWLAPGEPPVILSMGRLVPEKDFPTLIRAFAHLARARPARLVILGRATGEAKTRERQAELMGLAHELGVEERVLLPGFVQQPDAWLAHAALFALSSREEGFGNVLVEALAWGCPVVATDARGGGPREVLGDGRWGRLMPVGDDRALAQAMLAHLDRPPPRELLRARAEAFSVERGVDGYLSLALG
jgi:glycosyltransferase involved in cell wall biosynthesis